MRLATFNVENMFDRAKAMNLDTWADGNGVLEGFHRLNPRIQKSLYIDAIKSEQLTIVKHHKDLLTNDHRDCGEWQGTLITHALEVKMK